MQLSGKLQLSNSNMPMWNAQNNMLEKLCGHTNLRPFD